MVKVAEDKKIAIDHFTPHDLRRTAATCLAGIGFSDETIDAVLRHKKTGVVKIYNRHKYDAEKQKALEAWERKLKRITSGKGASGNVIPITAAKNKAGAVDNTALCRFAASAANVRPRGNAVGMHVDMTVKLG